MRLFMILGFSLALLVGCNAQASSAETESGGQPVIKLEAPLSHETATAISLTTGEAYSPWSSMEPETVSADDIGSLLFSKTLPDGTEVVCYWEPESKFTKYWAIRQADGRLLRFYQEESAYSEGYDVESFSDVLGQDGFRIIAPRGVAYQAYDYYTLDSSGMPRLLAACASDVIEADVDLDGETELLWFYHGGRDIYYIFRQEDVLREVCLSDLLEPAWLVAAAAPPFLEENCLPVNVLKGGWPALSPEAEFLPGRLRFTKDTVYLELEQP